MRRIDAHHHLWDADSGHRPMLSAVPVARFWGNSAGWADGTARLVACRDVAVKLSGPRLVRRDWSTDTIRPMILHLLGLFGSDRPMISSNVPVDLVMADCPTIVARIYRIAGEN